MGIVVVVFAAGYIGYEIFFSVETNKSQVLFEDDVTAESESGSDEDNSCKGLWVDVAGSVINPGVYCLKEAGIVQDALATAGGLSEDGCQVWVDRSLNRAQALQSSMKLYIPTIDDPECKSDPLAASDVARGVPGSVQTSNAGCPNGAINLNSATVSDLDTLPGVGPSLAQRIVDARPFSSVEELDGVSGVGDATFDKLAPLVCI
jgi:competence protein ComEA